MCGAECERIVHVLYIYRNVLPTVIINIFGEKLQELLGDNYI